MKYNQSLFYDLDTKSTFLVSKEQWDNAKREFEEQVFALHTNRIISSSCFSIRTETGVHHRWIFRKDQDYREDHVRGIR